MKKKIKLFSTIASLCLAVALMAFGVWAATEVDFKTTSKVTFTAATDVYGLYEAKVALNGTQKDIIKVKRDYEAESWSNVDGEKVTDLMSTSGAVLADQAVSAAGDTVVYTYTFTNNSPYALTYTFTSTASASDNKACTAASACSTNAITVAVNYGDGAVTGELDAGDSVTATVTVKLNCTHLASNVEIDTGMNLHVEKKAA